MAVAIGAACDFLTPIGHQCNTLVMGPGGYRFGDYWRLGLPLSVIVVIVGVPLIALVWPWWRGDPPTSGHAGICSRHSRPSGAKFGFDLAAQAFHAADHQPRAETALLRRRGMRAAALDPVDREFGIVGAPGNLDPALRT